VVSIALQYLGVPYVWGGASPSGFDCSGLTMYAYAKVGVYLPHNAAMQYGMGTPVTRSQLAPGDLVFFNGLSHVGMYIGGGRFVHAPHTGDVVKISSLSEYWYAATYVGLGATNRNLAQFLPSGISLDAEEFAHRKRPGLLPGRFSLDPSRYPHLGRR
jgi:cell wall-associated NlpC family hydrolase